VCASLTSASAQTYTSDFGNGGVITIQSLKRSGSDSVILKATISNEGKESLRLNELFVKTEPFDGYRFGATLQDAVAKKEYQQVLIEKNPVGSKHDGFVFIKPTEKLTVWARITAPPQEVEKITVVFHGSALPIDDVPIQR
jgi:hypothetical protein